jgi:hypothetical protein
MQVAKRGLLSGQSRNLVTDLAARSHLLDCARLRASVASRSAADLIFIPKHF